MAGGFDETSFPTTGDGSNNLLDATLYATFTYLPDTLLPKMWLHAKP
jgi:hypothetical protein